jgi:hypothetical protein
MRLACTYNICMTDEISKWLFCLKISIVTTVYFGTPCFYVAQAQTQFKITQDPVTWSIGVPNKGPVCRDIRIPSWTCAELKVCCVGGGGGTYVCTVDGNVCWNIYVHIYICIYIYLYIYAAVSNGKWKTEAQAIILNPFAVCSLCKWKFVVCSFVYEEINGS